MDIKENDSMVLLNEWVAIRVTLNTPITPGQRHVGMPIRHIIGQQTKRIAYKFLKNCLSHKIGFFFIKKFENDYHVMTMMIPDDRNVLAQKCVDSGTNKLAVNPKAIEAARNGRMFYKQGHYERAVTEFKTSLNERESVMGSYDVSTAGMYFFIGNCYFQMNDYDNALVAYRARLRIRRLLADDHDDTAKHTMDRRTILSLEKKGFNAEEIKQYDRYINVSIDYEKKGDIYRTEGNYSEAIRKYKQAILVEKKSLVGTKVTVAFLWRKVVLLLGEGNDEASTDSSHYSEDTESNCNKHDDKTNSPRLRNEQQIMKMTPKTRKSLDCSSSLSSCKRNEFNIFLKIRNLAVDGSQEKRELNWQSIVDCIDRTTNSNENINREGRGRRVSMIGMDNMKQERDRRKLHRRSFNGLDWQIRTKKDLLVKPRLPSSLFSFEEDSDEEECDK